MLKGEEGRVVQKRPSSVPELSLLCCDEEKTRKVIGGERASERKSERCSNERTSGASQEAWAQP